MQINNERLKRVISKNGIVLFILVGYYFLNTKLNIKIYCLFYKLTGYLCPGCGITRYFIAMAHFDFKAAFMANQFIFIFLPIFMIYYIYYLYNYVSGNTNYYKIPKFIYYIILAILIIFALVRNFLLK